MSNSVALCDVYEMPCVVCVDTLRLEIDMRKRESGTLYSVTLCDVYEMPYVWSGLLCCLAHTEW